ncbi:ATP-binding cassette domain-containing protein [Streptomyces arenae]|uniref:ATP-binding cassette domain-containing protein n=1 Tax=Streptomyces arenae TaxID=29301 RepID=UPI00265A8DBB|nr:ATP-binding cassette domain-containing protein [Streptomyces arenae]MCG7209085.1 ATP-binding cassette domain-containing protein [Streptomyces arenae]
MTTAEQWRDPVAVRALARRRGGGLLRVRKRVLLRLAFWSVLEAGQTFLLGYALARALDAGFLAGDVRTGLAWLAAAGGGVGVGAYGTRRVYGVAADLVEPVRDRLVAGVVARGVREADRGALSGLTQQAEIARDALAGLVMVSRSFVFTVAGALAGLCALALPLLLVVGPPLLAGLVLFAATLRPLARRQEAFLVADEALAGGLGEVCQGLRDVTAAGAEKRVAADVGERVDAEYRAARALARWSVVRVAALAVGGQLPSVLLLAAAPWLLRHGVTAGALVGALAYVTQSLLPALQNLVHGLGTGGTRLTVVLRRLQPPGKIAPPSQHRLATTPAAPPGSAHGTGRHTAPAAPPDGPHVTSGTAAPAAPPGSALGTGRHTAPAPPDGPHLTSGPTTPAPQTAAFGSGVAAGAGVPALVLRHVTFAYGPASAAVLDRLDLRVPQGGHLAVVGPSGIGKSTLTAVVAGLLEPAHGEVRVCGHPVPGARAAALRVLIPQEAYVCTGTLAENLGLLRADPVPEPELLAAAEAVGLAPLLERLGGPDAPVRPAVLSAGERQLIALARAYLSPAPLALLDEATCHLDPAAEARAEQAFAARPGGTLVVVAHRIDSARRAGRILVMDGPRTSYGTHGELLRTCPLYRELVAPSARPLTLHDGPAASEPPLAL